MILVLSAVLQLAASVADAKNLYVDRTRGNDATSYAANSAEQPWATIGRAAWGSIDRSRPNSAEAAAAGDTVLVAAGTYTTAGINERYEISYNPVNSGAAGSPITFEAVGVVRLELSSPGVVIGSNNKDYITWRGFTIDDRTNPRFRSDGLIKVLNAGNVVFDRLTIIGRNPSPLEGDNYTGIWCDGCEPGTVIKNSSFRNFGSGDENNAGITTYYSGGVTIERNDFINSGSGIYVKANFRSAAPYGFAGLTIRFNRFIGNRNGIRFHRHPSTESDTLFYQNVLSGNQQGVVFEPFDQQSGTSEPKNIKVLNNTLYNNGIHISANYSLAPNSRNVVANNVASGGQYIMAYGAYGGTLAYSADRISFDRNVGHGATISYGLTVDDRRSLDQWKAYTGEDDNSTTANPMFVSPSGGDFRLLPGSPVVTLGRALFGIGGLLGSAIPPGAFITGGEQIGAGSVVSNLPSAPNNFRIVP